VPLALKFLETLEKAFPGVVPFVYMSPSFVDTLGSEFVEPLKKYDLWTANYRVAHPTIPLPWDTFKFWQYSDKGKINGVNADIDLDAFNGTLEELKALTVQFAVDADLSVLSQATAKKTLDCCRCCKCCKCCCHRK
jgi:lysozyme